MSQEQPMSTNRDKPQKMKNACLSSKQRTDKFDNRWSTTVEVEGGTLMCLDGNAIGSHLAVGGRNIFRIYDIASAEMTEVANLRCERNVSNLSYSVCDLSWSSLNDALIASATPDGAIILWNINYVEQTGYWSHSQGHVFNQNRRTVHRVTFHPSEANILLSGSQDGSVRLFDIRTKEQKLNFTRCSESCVRDVKFDPKFPHHFAAGDENGTVRLWDIRNPNKYENVLQAHVGPCFTLDWHPEQRWLATGGRDRTVQVWDLSSSATANALSQYSAQSIASIARVHWRPFHRYQLVASASIINFGINAWDVRHPHLPTLFSGRHADVVTGILWKNHPNVLYTVGKDNRLCRILFSEGKQLGLRSNPVAVDINNNGTVVNAVSDRILNVKNNQVSSQNSSNQLTKKTYVPAKSAESAMLFVKSTMTEYTKAHESLSMRQFETMANKYQIAGATVAKLCDNNARVAKRVQRPDIERVWLMLKLIYDMEIAAFTSVSCAIETSSDDSTVVGQTPAEAPNNQDFPDVEFPASIMDETIANYYDIVSDDDYYYKEKRCPVLPEEGVQIFEIQPDEIGKSIYNSYGCNPWLSSRNTQWKRKWIDTQWIVMEERLNTDLLNAVPLRTTMELPNYTQTVASMIRYYAEQNDVQTAVSVILVLGERTRLLFEPEVLEQWFLSYIDLLHRFELWSVAADVVKHSKVIKVVNMSHLSTTIKTACQKCSRPLQKGETSCRKCRNPAKLCIICHLTVKGLYIWCRGCGHGGHLKHVQDWFINHKVCPSGCGHLCEYQ